jgi:hypothetical protein
MKIWCQEPFSYAMRNIRHWLYCVIQAYLWYCVTQSNYARNGVDAVMA